MRNLLLSAALAITGLFGAAQAAEPIQANKEYVELQSPMPVAEPGKIEVVEVFWYGCPHCYQFEPTINAWVDKLPDDVNFVRIPAQFNDLWGAHAQLFFTLEVMKVEAKVHRAIFEGIHEKHDPKLLGTRDGRKMIPPSAEDMADFVATQGVDKAAFLKTYNSFAVANRMKKAAKLVVGYQITGVPVLIVNGKYRFDVASAGGPEQALQVADFLIDKERAGR